MQLDLDDYGLDDDDGLEMVRRGDKCQNSFSLRQTEGTAGRERGGATLPTMSGS